MNVFGALASRLLFSVAVCPCVSGHVLGRCACSHNKATTSFLTALVTSVSGEQSRAEAEPCACVCGVGGGGGGGEEEVGDTIVWSCHWC